MKLTLVYNWAEWCAPCRQMSPLVEQFATDHPEIEVVKRNVDQAKGYESLPPLLSVPTLWLIRDGELVWQWNGAATRQHLETAIERHK